MPKGITKTNPKKGNEQQLLFAFGVSHKTAPIEIREKLCIADDEIPRLLARLKETLSECIVLSTCNRTEIYGVSDSAEIDLDLYKDLVIEFTNARETVTREHFFTFISCRACRQLFNVATSIDSKIVGDTQILQQLRNAYFRARENAATGKILNQLAQRAFKIGKRTYAETYIHEGAVSISLAAVETAVETFDSLKDRSVLIIGAGETGRQTAACLIKKQVGRILITNRTRTRAEELIGDLHKNHNFEGTVIDFNDFKSYLNKTDIVISSTSSLEYILRKEDFAEQTNKILLIDTAIPHDIEPSVKAENKNVVLKNIDDLNSVVDNNFKRRMKDLPQVKHIIMKEMSDFLLWYYALPLLPVFQKTRSKPAKSTVEEIVRVKQFLIRNVSQLHNLAIENKSSPKDDLQNHIQLVEKLQSMKKASFV